MNLKKYAVAAVMLSIVPMQAAFASQATTYATLHASEPPVAAGQGRIYFYREDGLMGVAIQPTIMINGETSGGRAKPGDYFYVDRPAGAYTVSTSTEKDESTSVTVVAGEPVYVKFEVSMGFFAGHVSPSVVDAQKAADEIKDCDWHGPEAAGATASTAAPADSASTASTGAQPSKTP